jgi:hypothetical protein
MYLENYIPRHKMEFWYKVQSQSEAVNATINTLVDKSGLNRNATGGNAVKQVDANRINKMTYLYFNGSNSHYTWTGNLTLKHLFVVIAINGATFTDYAGIISGNQNADPGLLAGNNGDNKLFDNGYASTYKLSDVIYANNNQLAPMGGEFAIIEWQYETGINLTGLQIGKDRQFAGRLLNGKFVEAFGFSEIKQGHQRCEIYEYLAINYHLWSKVATGQDVFPFPSNHSRSIEPTLNYLESQPYNGDSQFVLTGTNKKTFNLPFNQRHRAETVAAVKFSDQHFPSSKIVIRDYSLNQIQDTIVRMGSPVVEAGIDGQPYLANYQFNAKQV